MSKDPRYEIENEEIKELMLEIGNHLKKLMPEGWGFAVQIFQFNGEAFFYASSAERETMVKALREFIQREQ